MPKVTRLVRRYCGLMTALVAVIFTATQAAAQDYQLSGPDGSVRAGYFVVEASLRESAEEPVSLSELQLQQATSTDFNNPKRYRFFGDFSELTATGVPSGHYFLRLVDEQGQSHSNVIEVTVDHYPLWQALSLFGIGLLLFVTLVATQFYFFKRTTTQASQGVKHE
ncbi:hypothetical protein [Pseudidiomarina aestuarii]|uniref:hypothetical protein n=1 Tax=Pseudidiomarina aestuarii TaxID=624146 RepID=UPI003A9879A5